MTSPPYPPGRDKGRATVTLPHVSRRASRPMFVDEVVSYSKVVRFDLLCPDWLPSISLALFPASTLKSCLKH